VNGVHDMGGMEGLGQLEPQTDEPVFHAPWEGRTFAMVLAAGAWRRWNIDESRHQRELIPGPDYLAMTYYERWFAGLVALAVKTGLITREEAQSGRPAPGSIKADPPLKADRVEATMSRPSRHKADAAQAPRFQVGQAIRARNINPHGHTRLPRYARGKAGVLADTRGVHSFPDTNAHGLGANPQPLYSVRFEAAELWGPQTTSRDAVYLDLWESYLEPA
jgi:nitrile hydratase beta subunit